ncbi:MAG: hypothetical protein PHQ90_04150 [Sulfuricurvum sp.]|uniref:hypothetical protein n=1 Tax=Sulfuricurvum sp. TaxID=2025608 RepID=UPI00262ED926|nr:hypothetical protein [Sulfuricurvum sp.]MDD2368471.1 hypothetical protein [Sulfuricurvum sp.]MDD2950400.1 hypothetical protein [Sulfuricurvum sp.]MDD5118434.1 hypothetical protein [Sulfuricurvum sp.]
MKKKVLLVLMSGCMYTSLSAANFDVGVSGSDRGINGFSLSIGDYYRVPQQEIVVIERSIPRDEMSVVYYLARESHRDPRYIRDLRIRGFSWWDITLRLGLDPRRIYVINSHRHFGPPYGEAYGYSKNRHHLRDAEIVDLVNVRFLSDYHHISPDEVIDRRRKGERYMNIDEHYRGYNNRIEHREMRREERREDRGDNGRGNDHGRDR